MMNNIYFVRKAKEIAENFKTLYVMGCFGAPMTGTNKTRYMNNNSYNRQPARQLMIQQASSDTYGFDCVCLIKGILWGWNGSPSGYGGAVYASNGVPDISADTMITKCSGVSTNFSDVIPGEMLWKTGHAGIYIGNGMAVECTPAWKNCVQITDVANILSTGDRPARTWTKHGRLPWVSYESQLPFVDVSASSWYYDGLVKCYNTGLISGTDPTHFSPNENVTRAQLVTVLGKLIK